MMTMIHPLHLVEMEYFWSIALCVRRMRHASPGYSYVPVKILYFAWCPHLASCPNVQSPRQLRTNQHHMRVRPNLWSRHVIRDCSPCSGMKAIV